MILPLPPGRGARCGWGRWFAAPSGRRIATMPCHPLPLLPLSLLRRGLFQRVCLSVWCAISSGVVAPRRRAPLDMGVTWAANLPRSPGGDEDHRLPRWTASARPHALLLGVPLPGTMVSSPC